MTSPLVPAQKATSRIGVGLPYAALALILAAVVSPDIEISAELPAIRLEQLLLAVLIPWLGLVWSRDMAARELTALDAAFAALAVAVAISIAVSPALVDGAARSVRDVFEVARVAEYWLLYRVGIVAGGTTRGPATALALVAVVAVGEALFSVVQYLHPGDFNYEISRVWTEENNLLALERRGRVIGSIGNANYYGILATVTLFAGAAWLAVRPADRRSRGLAVAAIAASSASIVLAQSRTVAGATVVAICVLGVIVVADRRRRWIAGIAPAGGVLLASTVAVSLFMVIVPPRFGGLTERFDLRAVLDDPALTTRLAKWKSLFAADAAGSTADACTSAGVDAIAPAPGHEPASQTGSAAAPPEVAARDRQRKRDVSDIYRGLLDYRCRYGAWPEPDELESALAPEFLPAVPVDPDTGNPYEVFVHVSGFTVAATLEDASDPAGPTFAVGTIPSVVVNPSFEDGRSRPSSWSPIGPAEVRPLPGRGLFGERAASLELPPGTRDGSIASLRQVLPVTIYSDAPYVAAAWARTDEPEPQALQMLLVAITEDGAQVEAFAAGNVTVVPGRHWQRLELPFRSPSAPRIIELRLFFLAPYASTPVRVDLDGVTLTLGTVAPSFPLVRDLDPSAVTIAGEPGFRESPFIGVGPNKAATTTFDNEYALFLDRYGILGTLAYIGVWAATGMIAFRTARTSSNEAAALAGAVVGSTVALAVFNFAAGGYYDFQLMGIFWPLAGIAAGARSLPALASRQR